MPVRPVTNDLSRATGRRLRTLREARGVSLGALAASAGLGKGTLSELETGRRNPTLATLFAITTALDVPLSTALPPAPATAPATSPPVRGAAIDAVLVDRFDDLTAVTELYRVTVRAGAAQASAAHAPGVTEHWILYGGALELGPADAVERLAAGESTTFTADVAHRYAADPGEDVAATLVVRYPR